MGDVEADPQWPKYARMPQSKCKRRDGLGRAIGLFVDHMIVVGLNTERASSLCCGYFATNGLPPVVCFSNWLLMGS